MNRSLRLLTIILTASASLSRSTNNLTAVDLESTSDRSTACICNATLTPAQTAAHTLSTDTSIKPTPTSPPTIRNITCNTTLISDPSTTSSIAKNITNVSFRIIITILSLLNTNFAWRIHGKLEATNLRIRTYSSNSTSRPTATSACKGKYSAGSPLDRYNGHPSLPDPTCT